MNLKVFVLITAVSYLLVSCSGNDKNVNGKEDPGTENPEEEVNPPREPLTLIADSASLELKDFATDKPELITASAQYYKPLRFPYQDSVNRRVFAFITSFESEYGYSAAPYTEMSHSVLQNCLESFRNDYRSEVDAFDFPVMYSMELKANVDTNYRDFDIVHTYYNVYSGGAHGNSGNFYTWIDHETGKTIRFSDLVSDTMAFNRIAKPYFVKAVGLKPGANLAEAGFWFPNDRFSCNSNFYPDGDQIAFLFNAYEVNAYAMGPISFRVPLADVRHLLRVDLSK